MRLIITCSRRFFKTKNGIVWTPSIDDYHFWKRYLAVFDEVIVLARVKSIDTNKFKGNFASGPNISFIEIPYYIGLRGFLKNIIKIFKTINTNIYKNDAIILRVPSHISICTEIVLSIKKMKYQVEVVGNPYDAYNVNSINHPFKYILSWISIFNLKRVCRNAQVAAYVTTNGLQNLFPARPKAFITSYSSVEIKSSLIVKNPKKVSYKNKKSLKIISVGSMELKYKRFDILIEAFRKCINDGYNLKLIIIGDGRNLNYFQSIAKNASKKIEFLGELPGFNYVRKELIKADLFILTSTYEGLPRVIIEAMSVGLPVIATNLIGIRELLHRDDLIKPGDIESLYRKMKEVFLDKNRLNQMSKRNLNRVKSFSDIILAPKRIEAYRHLKSIITNK